MLLITQQDEFCAFRRLSLSTVGVAQAMRHHDEHSRQPIAQYHFPKAAHAILHLSSK
jgi:hypothetical protein